MKYSRLKFSGSVKNMYFKNYFIVRLLVLQKECYSKFNFRWFMKKIKFTFKPLWILKSKNLENVGLGPLKSLLKNPYLLLLWSLKKIPPINQSWSLKVFLKKATLGLKNPSLRSALTVLVIEISSLNLGPRHFFSKIQV